MSTARRIRTSKIKASPFLRFYEEPDAVFGVYAKRCFYIRGESEQEYWQLRRQSVLYDVPEKPVQIDGPDSASFLQRIFCRPVANMPLGVGRYAIACTHRGGIFMDGILFRLSENRFWYVQADGELETWLLAHSADYEVTISDPNSWVLQIQGPTSMDIMKAATDNAINENMRYFQSGFFQVCGQRTYISRTGWTGELGYEIYTQDGETDYEKLWKDLIAVGRQYNMAIGTGGSMDTRRIEAGILNNGTDIDQTMTPFDAGLGALVDFSNECFIGRQALLVASREPVLFGVSCKTHTPTKNNLIIQSGKSVGQVRTGVWSPQLETGIGYVRFYKADHWGGTSLSMIDEDGEDHPCDIVSLPFIDPEKRLPRGG